LVHRSHQAAKMKQTSGPTKKAPAGAVLKDIRRATRRQFTAEEKIRIVLEGLRGEESIAELCRREGISSSMYHVRGRSAICSCRQTARGPMGAQAQDRGVGGPGAGETVG
jgi:transposase-like protein